MSVYSNRGFISLIRGFLVIFSWFLLMFEVVYGSFYRYSPSWICLIKMSLSHIVTFSHECYKWRDIRLLVRIKCIFIINKMYLIWRSIWKDKSIR